MIPPAARSGAVEPAQHDGQRGHRHQPGQRRCRADQPVEPARGEDAREERDQPGGGEGRGQEAGGRIGVVAVAAADHLAPGDQGRAKDERADDAPDRREQPVFHAVLHHEDARQRQRQPGQRQRPVAAEPAAEGLQPVLSEHIGARIEIGGRLWGGGICGRGADFRRGVVRGCGCGGSGRAWGALAVRRVLPVGVQGGGEGLGAQFERLDPAFQPRMRDQQVGNADHDQKTENRTQNAQNFHTPIP